MSKYKMTMTKEMYYCWVSACIADRDPYAILGALVSVDSSGIDLFQVEGSEGSAGEQLPMRHSLGDSLVLKIANHLKHSTVIHDQFYYALVS